MFEAISGHCPTWFRRTTVQVIINRSSTMQPAACRVCWFAMNNFIAPSSSLSCVAFVCSSSASPFVEKWRLAFTNATPASLKITPYLIAFHESYTKKKSTISSERVLKKARAPHCFTITHVRPMTSRIRVVHAVLCSYPSLCGPQVVPSSLLQ